MTKKDESKKDKIEQEKELAKKQQEEEVAKQEEKEAKAKAKEEKEAKAKESKIQSPEAIRRKEFQIKKLQLQALINKASEARKAVIKAKAELPEFQSEFQPVDKKQEFNQSDILFMNTYMSKSHSIAEAKEALKKERQLKPKIKTLPNIDTIKGKAKAQKKIDDEKKALELKNKKDKASLAASKKAQEDDIEKKKKTNAKIQSEIAKLKSELAASEKAKEKEQLEA